MYQPINEKISVVGIYDQSQFTPKKFKWRGRVYPISEITLTADTKDGGVRNRLYSVVAEANVYRIKFNRDSEAWLLEEVWYES